MKKGFDCALCLHKKVCKYRDTVELWSKRNRFEATTQELKNFCNIVATFPEPLKVKIECEKFIDEVNNE